MRIHNPGDSPIIEPTICKALPSIKKTRKLTADYIRRADLSRRVTGGGSPGRPGGRECAASRGWGAPATPAAAPQRPTPSPGWLSQIHHRNGSPATQPVWIFTFWGIRINIFFARQDQKSIRVRENQHGAQKSMKTKFRLIMCYGSCYFVSDLQDGNFWFFLRITFWCNSYIIFQRKKVIKKLQNSKNQGFS